MSQVLYDMINNRAKASYNGPERIAANNYGIWVKHWFETATALRNEFIREELYKTANAITYIIVEQQNYCKKYLDNIG